MTRNSETRSICAVLIGQGSLPSSLLEAAAAIVGDSSGATVVSNAGCSLELLDQDLERAIASFPPGSEIIIFSDLLGSSCSNAALSLVKKRPDVALICGTNLPMLVRFFK